MYHQKFKRYGSTNVFIWNSDRSWFGNGFVGCG
nr:MAG TPA: pilus formation protein [Caudoviricetes sp.]